jgi:hypothetical protein
VFVLCPYLGDYVCHIFVRMHAGGVVYRAGTEISTIGIGRVDMHCTRCYDPRGYMTLQTLIAAIDWTWRCIFDNRISKELESPLCFLVAFGRIDVFRFEG